MSYNIEIKDIEPVRVAYTNFKGLVTNANKEFPRIYKSIMGKSNGAPFFNYLSMDTQTKIGEIELCVPTDVFISSNGIEIKNMPRIKAITVIHIGTYETLFNAYCAINEYAKNNKIKLAEHVREVYIKGPGMILKGNPSKYITELQFPIVEI